MRLIKYLLLLATIFILPVKAAVPFRVKLSNGQVLENWTRGIELDLNGFTASTTNGIVFLDTVSGGGGGGGGGGSGTVTSVAANNGDDLLTITGSPITTNGTLTFTVNEGNFTLTESQISDLSHTADTNANTACTGTTTYLDGEGNCDDISSVYQPLDADLTTLAGNDGSNLTGITGTNITDGTIGAADLGTDSVGSDEIAADSVGASELANNSVASANIINGEVVTVDLADSAVTTAKIADASVTDAKIVSVEGSKINGDLSNVNNIFADDEVHSRLFNGAVFNGGVFSGDGSGLTGITGTNITDGTIGAADLGTDSVGSDEIAADSVGSDELAADSVGASEIAADSVGASEIAADSVGASELADNSVASANIINGEVMTVDLADSAVTTTKLANGSVTNDKIVTVDGSKITGTIDNATITNANVEGDLTVNGNIFANDEVHARLFNGEVFNGGEFNGTFVGDGSNLTGVDAATVDSIDGASLLRSDADDSFTAGTLTIDANGAFNQSVYFDTEVDDGNSSTADTIDWRTGNKHKSTMTGNCTYTFTAPGGPTNLILKLVQDATGSRTATWPASVKWSAGTAPTLTTTASAIDIVTCYYDGTNYFCAFGGDFK